MQNRWQKIKKEAKELAEELREQAVIPDNQDEITNEHRAAGDLSEKARAAEERVEALTRMLAEAKKDEEAAKTAQAKAKEAEAKKLIAEEAKKALEDKKKNSEAAKTAARAALRHRLRCHAVCICVCVCIFVCVCNDCLRYPIHVGAGRYCC